MRRTAIVALLLLGPATAAMSGRRSLIKGYFWRCAGRECGHVFGLLLRRIGYAGLDVVR
jgi:hypothetical protein